MNGSWDAYLAPTTDFAGADDINQDQLVLQCTLNGHEVETENEKITVMCPHSQQNLEFGHFTFVIWPSTANRIVPNFKTHV